MPGKSYPFASVIIKSKEPGILGTDRILKLLACEDAAAAASLLAEWGYGGGEPEGAGGYERLISREMNDAYELVERISPDPETTDLFFLRHDYHNLKVLLKSEETGIGANEKNLAGFGTIAVAALLSAVAEKKYGSLTTHMRGALLELGRAFLLSSDLSLIDVTLDQAYADEIRERIREKKGFIKKYFFHMFDFENILILLRAREAKLSADLFSRALLPEGNLSKKELLKAYELAAEDLKSRLARGEHSDGIGAALDAYFSSGNLQALEKYRDDTLLGIAAGVKNDLFTIGPVVHYLVKKEREAKAVKMAMTAKLSGWKAEDVQKILFEV